MAYDLRYESWIPFRRRSGRVDWLPPYRVTDGITADPIVALACPRPDFDAALIEFLIGLFTVAMGANDEADWRRFRDSPPDPESLQKKLDALPDAFVLDGEGPRVFQDFDPLADVKPSEIGALLIDAPGEQTTKYNKDVFVKRGQVRAIGRPAAAMALITMQTYAPSGGAGNRTSMRGGGPLTTLVEPRLIPNAEPLWALIWANAETVDQISARDTRNDVAWDERHRFPWLAPTRTSNEKAQGRSLRPADAAPEQVYFGLPRRIRLELKAGPCTCDLTGRRDDVCIVGFRSRPHGINYAEWTHPLSPYYHTAASGYLPVHGQPAGVGWHDWQGLLFSQPDSTGDRPALAVSHYRSRRAQSPFRLLAFGYDVDNMKARGWIQAELPAFPDEMLARTRIFTAQATGAADITAGLVVRTIKSAIFDNPKDAPGDFSHYRHAVWAVTQSAFFSHIEKLASGRETANAEIAISFREALRDAALAVFDQACPLDSFPIEQMKRPIGARHSLSLAVNGYGKNGANFFKALGLTPPEAGKARKAERAQKAGKQRRETMA